MQHKCKNCLQEIYFQPITEQWYHKANSQAWCCTVSDRKGAEPMEKYVRLPEGLDEINATLQRIRQLTLDGDTSKLLEVDHNYIDHISENYSQLLEDYLRLKGQWTHDRILKLQQGMNDA